jgi:hypothetical protein
MNHLMISWCVIWSRTNNNTLDKRINGWQIFLTVNLVNRYGIYVSKMIVCHNHNHILSSFMTYHQMCNKSNITCATKELMNPNLVSGIRVAQSIFLCSVFRPCFEFLSSSCWPLSCLSFYDLQPLVTLWYLQAFLQDNKILRPFHPWSQQK